MVTILSVYPPGKGFELNSKAESSASFLFPEKSTPFPNCQKTAGFSGSLLLLCLNLPHILHGYSALRSVDFAEQTKKAAYPLLRRRCRCVYLVELRGVEPLTS